MDSLNEHVGGDDVYASFADPVDRRVVGDAGDEVIVAGLAEYTPQPVDESELADGADGGEFAAGGHVGFRRLVIAASRRHANLAEKGPFRGAGDGGHVRGDAVYRLVREDGETERFFGVGVQTEFVHRSHGDGREGVLETLHQKIVVPPSPGDD